MTSPAPRRLLATDADEHNDMALLAAAVTQPHRLGGGGDTAVVVNFSEDQLGRPSILHDLATPFVRPPAGALRSTAATRVGRVHVPNGDVLSPAGNAAAVAAANLEKPVSITHESTRADRDFPMCRVVDNLDDAGRSSSASAADPSGNTAADEQAITDGLRRAVAAQLRPSVHNAVTTAKLANELYARVAAAQDALTTPAVRAASSSASASESEPIPGRKRSRSSATAAIPPPADFIRVVEALQRAQSEQRAWQSYAKEANAIAATAAQNHTELMHAAAGLKDRLADALNDGLTEVGLRSDALACQQHCAFVWRTTANAMHRIEPVRLSLYQEAEQAARITASGSLVVQERLDMLRRICPDLAAARRSCDAPLPPPPCDPAAESRRRRSAAYSGDDSEDDDTQLLLAPVSPRGAGRQLTDVPSPAPIRSADTTEGVVASMWRRLRSLISPDPAPASHNITSDAASTSASATI